MALRADRALVLTGQAQLDLAGRPVPFEELTKYSWGGEAILESRHGDITQAAGSIIDLSARYNRAGRLTAIALDPGAGRVDLQGRILGSASGDYETGGSRVPYAQGAVDIRAQQLDFTALNQRLNAGSVYGARSFQIKRGDLTIGDEVRAREVNISVDAGSLTVAGRIDASGVSVGSIRLSARDGLRLASNAVLDAHGATLRVDSYGQIIDAPNRAIVELKAGQGTLRLDGGARIDLRAGSDDPRQDGKPRGTLELNAPRLNGARGGDIDIEARGPLDIRGARSVAVNGVWVDRSATPAPKPLPAASYQIIDQDYLDRLHDDSRAFITGAGQRQPGRRQAGRPAPLCRRAAPAPRHRDPQRHARRRPGGAGRPGPVPLPLRQPQPAHPADRRLRLGRSRQPGDPRRRRQIHGSINDGFAPPRT